MGGKTQSAPAKGGNHRPSYGTPEFREPLVLNDSVIKFLEKNPRTTPGWNIIELGFFFGVRFQ